MSDFLNAIASQSSGLKVTQSVINVEFKFVLSPKYIYCYPYQNVIILKGVRASQAFSSFRVESHSLTNYKSYETSKVMKYPKHHKILEGIRVRASWAFCSLRVESLSFTKYQRYETTLNCNNLVCHYLVCHNLVEGIVQMIS